jgi:hypothetical protein
VEKIDEKGQKEYLGGRTMNCSTGTGRKVKDSYGEVNNTEKIHQVQEDRKFSLLLKVLELFLRHPILVLAYKWEL